LVNKGVECPDIQVVVPSIVLNQQSVGPESAINFNIEDCQEMARLTMKRRSPVMVEANAKANPAMEALMLGVMRQTSPVAPTIPAESRLKRTESQRFTMKY
jgi:hypothetical protein